MRYLRAVGLVLVGTALLAGSLTAGNQWLTDRDATSEVDGTTDSVPRAEVARSISGHLSLPVILRGPRSVDCTRDLRAVKGAWVHCTAHYLRGTDRGMTVRVVRVRGGQITYVHDAPHR
ncbi:DUF4333 domain-containing protein [Streptomyces inhibens]|uniref:DUF4333 domain-containing protein n=1 Tax=Streptomyces inhibens TaxID=2293571 RepID=A0A371Q9P9_STRIH|nr:DUF4333 domain-containing protein [Streptomyces inhibens]REK91429.1 DUF4333 domain-containing protein [Streptomyces inhibens]